MFSSWWSDNFYTNWLTVYLIGIRYLFIISRNGKMVLKNIALIQILTAFITLFSIQRNLWFLVIYWKKCLWRVVPIRLKSVDLQLITRNFWKLISALHKEVIFIFYIHTSYFFNKLLVLKIEPIAIVLSFSEKFELVLKQVRWQCYKRQEISRSIHIRFNY